MSQSFLPRRRRRRASVWFGLAALLVAATALLLFLLRNERIVERVANDKSIRVLLPPPPPPPPPEPRPEPEPEEIAEPLPDLASDAPPEPEPVEDAPGDALTAREGDAAGNFGLQKGDGGGTRIGGGTSGGDPFAAYAQAMLAEVNRAVQRDSELAKGRYSVQLAVDVAADGAIRAVTFLQGSGSDSRDERLRALLAGLRLSRAPPDGLPTVRLELTSRPSL